MVVYVCSPYRGDIQKNTELARRICRKAALEGNVVICPHLLYPQFLSDEDAEEREIGIRAGLKSLDMTDEVWIADGDISEGMLREIVTAQELGIPTRVIKREEL